VIENDKCGTNNDEKKKIFLVRVIIKM